MVTTTSLLRDMVEQVGGERVHVTSLVPDGADPHAYEPSMRDRDAMSDVGVWPSLLSEALEELRDAAQ